jgi:hypothetical protein
MILALDMATRTGWCQGVVGALPAWGAHDFGRGKSNGEVLAAFRAAETRFEIATDSEGLELIPIERVRGVPNRCRVKLFRPRAEKDRLCAFFYKRSNLAWSRDRFSYGGVEFLPGEVGKLETAAWIDWLASGFDPERRPARLKRAFLYDIPD